MLSDQRREEIVSRVQTVGHIAVRDLAEALAVSDATIRRDLRQLADEGRLELVYGGATLPRMRDHSIQGRTRREAEAKRVVGRLAAGLVADDEMLFVDSGTTCFEMRRHLARRSGLSIIVNSARLAMELGAGASVVMIGGHYRPERMDNIGPLAVAAIEQLRGYLAFIGADGLDPEFGLTATDIQTSFLYQHVLRNAREAILCVDHTKFLSPSLFRICGWEAISRVVTDRPPGEEWRSLLHSAGIELICPEPCATPHEEENPCPDPR